MNLLTRFPQSVTRLTRLAAIFALLGLVTFTVGLLVPRPLPVILSMSLGHGLGLTAALLYLVAIVIDTTRPNRRSAIPAPPPKTEPAESLRTHK